MILRTSYFAKVKNLGEEYIKVGITAIPPKWWKSSNINTLAPSKELLFKWKNGEITEEEYEIMYVSELDHKEDYIRKFIGFLDRNTSKCVVLCCYEKSTSFCHRHTLAKWINKKLGIGVSELE